MLALQQSVSLPQCLLPSQMDVQVGGTWRMTEKHKVQGFLLSFSIV